MAILFLEDANKYPSGSTGWADLCNDNPDVTNGGASNASVAGTSGRFGLKAVDHGIIVGKDLTYPFNSVGGSGSVIMGVMMAFYNISTNTPIELFSVVTTAGGSFRSVRLYAALNTLVVYDATGAIVGEASGPWLSLGRHNLIEMKVNCANSGSCEVKVDGVTVLNITATDFLYSTATVPDYVRFFDGNRYTYSSWWYVADTSGSAPLNDFLGDFRIEYAVPDADGATANWTNIGGGSNFQDVDDALAAYDDDTTYITSSTTDQDNYVSMGTLSLSGVNTILFAQQTALARNDGSGNIALLTNSSATVSASGDKTLSTSYAWKRKFDTVDPNTSAAWANAAALNAAEWGVRYR